MQLYYNYIMQIVIHMKSNRKIMVRNSIPTMVVAISKQCKVSRS